MSVNQKSRHVGLQALPKIRRNLQDELFLTSVLEVVGSRILAYYYGFTWWATSSCHKHSARLTIHVWREFFETVEKSRWLVTFLVSLPVSASYTQASAKQDIKHAGHGKQAAKHRPDDKETAKKSGRAVNKGTHKTAPKTEQAAQRVEHKTRAK